MNEMQCLTFTLCRFDFGVTLHVDVGRVIRCAKQGVSLLRRKTNFHEIKVFAYGTQSSTKTD